MIQLSDLKHSHVFIDERMTFVWVLNLLKYEILKASALFIESMIQKNSYFLEGLY